MRFVAEATFRTVPVKTAIASTLAIFGSLQDANEALPALVGTGATTLELMDATSLRVGQAFADAPPQIRDLRVDRQAALLVEFQATSEPELADMAAAGDRVLTGLPLVAPARLSSDAPARTRLWKLRKGLYTSVAGARPPGTTALLEDVVVPVEKLADTCLRLGVLFDEFAYTDSVIFGHAKDGNIHFMLTDRFESDQQLGRYTSFTEAMVDLVLGHGGSLKAEHGTGRVMAPYVRRQFGDELYDVMRRLKTLVDPGGMLNPGVILDDDPQAHLRHIKLQPKVEEEVDRCVECGYCEPVCPSRDLTLTPRQRIVARRAIASADQRGDARLVQELEDEYEYDGVQTCAVDGMCQTACPVLIDTGDLVKRLRREKTGRAAQSVSRRAAQHWSSVTRAAATALNVAGAVPAAVPGSATALTRRVVSTDVAPSWTPDLPLGGTRRSLGVPNRGVSPDTPVAALYLPACVNAMFGASGDAPGVQWSLEQLCARVGLRLSVPSDIDSLCCGTPWSSKGLPDGEEVMRERVTRTVETARALAGEGPLVVISDASSCTEGYLGMLRRSGVEVTVVDAVQFVAERVLPLLAAGERLESLSLHPTCSSTRIDANGALMEVARAVARDVHVPMSWGCCGFAGDRGMLHPELTASATAAQAAEVRERDASGHASCNRTCEIGMSRATGHDYRHLLEVLEEVTRAEPQSTRT